MTAGGMSSRIPRVPRLNRRSRLVLPIVVAVVLLIVLISVYDSVYTDLLWFRSVGFSSVFT
ncbi:MAG: hypothetical protein JO222_01010, partial [Frankiales bacterium]|nr:hypothetical protein [Frankiales bacterium]